ncbi:AAA family ATPase [Flavobacterium sharifuzzamanii]|uniref:AAA family ATPase n=1 Tax=Flavobacterium sharifuzzamanii TaxID=2211133 RepID=UPI000DAD634C|nr:ATP-binding protein [Flavobacterium sharifuzzamanii]KAF2079122.1 ATP-binding protein [Flavobacterium sharifuzzamanii]
MLTKFKVSNFKSFNEDFIFDLSETNAYNFNSECVKNGIVNNALIYGHNGVGKSNLAFAIFDIIEHLTDRETNNTEYSVYLNAYNKSETAHFYYEFLINSCKVVYEYKKINHKTILYEKFLINDKEFAFLDRKKKDNAIIKFKGAESLKTELTNSNLSLLKYIKNNTELDKNNDNKTFSLFFKFIEGMLFFRSLQSNFYLGIEVGKKGVVEDIIEKKNITDLERFLNEAGIECKLKVIDSTDKKTLAFDFNGKAIPFFNIASQGTRALVMFYFWFQRIKEKSKVSFLFIDEFDAFYHHELSALIVKELKKSGVQFILTTHNTSIITNDLLRPDCYFLMTKESIKSLAKSTSKELREAHNIEKMYKANSFNGQ